MRSANLLPIGPDGLRARRWHNDQGAAVINPIASWRALTVEGVTRCVQQLGEQGVTRVLTGALYTADQAPYRAAGFTVHQELHVLSHGLSNLEAPNVGTRRGRITRDGTHAIAVDHAAFPPFWQFDREGLVDAFTATSARRFRLIDDPRIGRRAPRAYAICGRSGAVGYIQRLAVDPRAQRQGFASALVLDGLRWMRRHRASHAVVNTQIDNARAMALYAHLGFEKLPDTMAILVRDGATP